MKLFRFVSKQVVVTHLRLASGNWNQLSTRSLEKFSIECRNAKNLLVATANQNELDYIISQWEPKGKTSKLLKGRENAATSLHLISLGVYNADFLDRTKRGNAKPMWSWLTFDTHWKLDVLNGGHCPNKGLPCNSNSVNVSFYQFDNMVNLSLLISCW